MNAFEIILLITMTVTICAMLYVAAKLSRLRKYLSWWEAFVKSKPFTPANPYEYTNKKEALKFLKIFSYLILFLVVLTVIFLNRT